MKHSVALAAKLAFILLVIAAVFSSCVPQKRIKYLQRKQEQDTAVFYQTKRDMNYLIQSRDNLYIRVYSLDPNASLFFNKQSSSSSYNDYANDASIYLNSYAVDDEGNIEFPIIGKVNVKGKTVNEINAIVLKLVSDYLKEVAVVVKLVNFKVTVVGEVMRPGEYTFYQNQVNLWEAISMAGDLGEFANRTKVALIRKTKDGSRVHYLDLTQENILRSEFYYLQPNDVLYISPLGYKRWGLGSTFPWAMILASISTTLLLINYFK
ncbi:MAG: polysaccharide biosynthesis/export family protein [Bacteroidetes bacterium]|nr:polysaccharide biosynthesis/export family protein [Bacteroidota bacterium]